MSRLCKLMTELSQIKSMTCLSFDLKEKVIAYYEREIAAVQPLGDGKGWKK